jgi:hypothetical protein
LEGHVLIILEYRMGIWYVWWTFGMFYEYLVCFLSIWYVLWVFGMYHEYLVSFMGIWCLLWCLLWVLGMFMSFWYVFWVFGIFMSIWYIIFLVQSVWFWYIAPGKIWQSWQWHDPPCILLGFLRSGLFRRWRRPRPASPLVLLTLGLLKPLFVIRVTRWALVFIKADYAPGLCVVLTVLNRPGVISKLAQNYWNCSIHPYTFLTASHKN